MADGVDPEDFLRELSSFNDEPVSKDGEPAPIPGVDPNRGRRRTEAAAIAASDGRRTADRHRIRKDAAAVTGGGAVASATRSNADPELASSNPDNERKSLIGLLLAAIATVLILSWIATSCLDGDGEGTIEATNESTSTTETADSTPTTAPTTTATTAPTTVAPVADLGTDANAALTAAGVTGVTATANGSTIVLTGSAVDEASKAAAQAAVEAVPGVEAVDNQIEIAATRDINAEANAVLAAAGITGVTATVTDGVAVLTGEAVNGEQRLAAELAMLNIPGIESVDNQITTPPTPAEILTGTLNGIVQASPIQFNTGSADIRSASTPILDQVIEVLNANPDGTVEIGGHTDSDGGAESNRELSQERAQSVLDYLVAGGVDPARLTAVGFGEDAPLVPNDSGDNKRKNRRIEFTVK